MNAPPQHRGWMQTFTGVQFWPLAPKVEDIRIEDIAHGCANVCRYGGHTRSFYSVAQHCVIVSNLVPAEDALWGLLHDASEAYLGDAIQPLKTQPAWEAFRAIEHRLQAAICQRFGLPEQQPASIKPADRIALVAEKRDLMGRAPTEDGWDAHGALPEAPPDLRIIPWTPSFAENRFLDRFYQLNQDRRWRAR